MAREVTLSDFDAAGKAGVVGGAAEGAGGGGIAFPCGDARLSSEGEGHAPASGIELGDAALRWKGSEDGTDDRGFAAFGRLQECAGWWGDGNARECGGWGTQYDYRLGFVFAVCPGDAGQRMGPGEFGQCKAIGQSERGVGAQEDIRAGVQQIGDHRGFAAKALEAAQKIAEWGEEGDKRGMEDEAGAEVDDLGATLAMQTEHHATLRAARGKVHASALTSGGDGDAMERDVGEAGAAEGHFQDAGFVGEVSVGRQIVECAAAAGAEMGADLSPLDIWHFPYQAPKADRPVWARPRIKAWTSWVPS